MERYLLQTPHANIILIPQSKKIQNSILKMSQFDSLKRDEKKVDKVKVYISHIEKVPPLRNKEFKLLGKIRTDYDLIKCFKANDEVLYVIKDKGYLLAKPDKYRLFLTDFYHLPFFILVIVILYNQWKRNFICIHSGCFRYRGDTYLLVGESEGGKTTFLLNLKKVIPKVEFICDDLSFIFSKNGNIYCRGIINSYKDSLVDYRKRKSIKASYMKRLLNQNYQDLIVDKVLFLDIAQRRYSCDREISLSESYQRLISCTTLWATFHYKQLVKGVETLFTLTKQAKCILLEVGADLKNVTPATRNTLDKLFQALRENKD